ncbi:hypothetical protein [Methylobrevis pamukkalensis]|uniref:Uncharacterized protein n=1 Tax=Methylobrevis pamukkalensis TaxID=1439726 RepID=A0A1E3GYS4_9HYPH|nr:hypothetical protein [Methylobrevis pamukkalensis]ODN69217.1 hypothetical protein A6302_03479 [Methylobrevis pamukkalensis]
MHMIILKFDTEDDARDILAAIARAQELQAHHELDPDEAPAEGGDARPCPLCGVVHVQAEWGGQSKHIDGLEPTSLRRQTKHFDFRLGQVVRVRRSNTIGRVIQQIASIDRASQYVLTFRNVSFMTRPLYANELAEVHPEEPGAEDFDPSDF